MQVIDYNSIHHLPQGNAYVSNDNWDFEYSIRISPKPKALESTTLLTALITHVDKIKILPKGII